MSRAKQPHRVRQGREQVMKADQNVDNSQEHQPRPFASAACPASEANSDPVSCLPDPVNTDRNLNLHAFHIHFRSFKAQLISGRDKFEKIGLQMYR